MSKKVYMLPDELAHTRSLLRHVFGTHAVQSQLEDKTYVAAELLGVDLLRLYFAGGSRPPLLALVGDQHCGAGLFITWIQELARFAKEPLLDVRTVNSLGDLRDDSGDHALLVLTGPLKPELKHLCGLVVQYNHFKKYNERGKCIGIDPIRASVLLCQMTEEGLDDYSAPVWRRVLKPLPGKPEDLIVQLRKEYAKLMELIVHQPFMTKACTENWFSPEQLIEPAAA